MTTFGYEMRLVKEMVPGVRNGLALSPRAVPRPMRMTPRPKHNEFTIRPDRALTVWQIQHPAGAEGSSLAHLSAVESKMDRHREMARQMGRSYEEVHAEEKLFEDQADILATLQWENPRSFFDKIDVDGSGSLSTDELREALMARGLSEKMAEPILRDFDADGDEEISRDEWTVGFYTSRLCTVPLPRGEDFSDLTGGSPGCRVPQTELRAITLRQLTDVFRHLSRRCTYEKWRNFFKEDLEPKTVTLYDLTRYVIRPCTFKRRCAYVELVANHAQRPRWFVSHWWGEFIYDFIACLSAHARDRMPNEKMDSAYWVCAYVRVPPARLDPAPTRSVDPSAISGLAVHRTACCLERHL